MKYQITIVLCLNIENENETNTTVFSNKNG